MKNSNFHPSHNIINPSGKRKKNISRLHETKKKKKVTKKYYQLYYIVVAASHAASPIRFDCLALTEPNSIHLLKIIKSNWVTSAFCHIELRKKFRWSSGWQWKINKNWLLEDNKHEKNNFRKKFVIRPYRLCRITKLKTYQVTVTINVIA